MGMIRSYLIIGGLADGEFHDIETASAFARTIVRSSPRPGEVEDSIYTLRTLKTDDGVICYYALKEWTDGYALRHRLFGFAADPPFEEK
jgi:hypothetical protein